MERRGCIAWAGLVGASAGEPLATAVELMYCVRGTMPCTDVETHRGASFSLAASTPENVVEAPTFRPKIKGRAKI